MPEQREAELLSQGWTRQFVANGPRLSEAVELYQSLGLDVLLEPLSARAGEGECRSCLDAAPEQYRIIYTRKAEKAAGASGDDFRSETKNGGEGRA